MPLQPFFKTKSNTATQEKQLKDSIDKEVEAEIKGFFATENLNAETEDAKVLNWWNLNKTSSCQLCNEIYFCTIIFCVF